MVIVTDLLPKRPLFVTFEISQKLLLPSPKMKKPEACASGREDLLRDYGSLCAGVTVALRLHVGVFVTVVPSE